MSTGGSSLGPKFLLGKESVALFSVISKGKGGKNVLPELQTATPRTDLRLCISLAYTIEPITCGLGAGLVPSSAPSRLK